MVIRFQPLDDPVIDDRSEKELVDRALVRVFNASGGRLNDFSSSSPARALIEGQAFAGAELLYRVNKLPNAMALAFLKLADIQRRLGTPAVTTLTFTLTAPLSSGFVIPQGYLVRAIGGITFATDASLTIPAGQTSGSISATCTVAGTIGNVAAFTLRELTTPLAFLGSVVNSIPATGGTNAETIDEVRARAFAAIRRRGLVTADDYEQEARAILGAGSVAHCIGNLAADRTTFQRGNVHVFCLNADGSLLNSAQLSQVQSQMQRRSHVTVTVHTSNIDVIDVDLYVIARSVPGSNPQTAADQIFANLRDYLKPGVLPLGETIVLKELEFCVRRAGVEFVQSVSIGRWLQPRLGTNFPLQYPYSAANLKSLAVELTDGANTFAQFYGTDYFGSGDPD